MEIAQAMEEEVIKSIIVAMGEDDSMTSSEQWKENHKQRRCNHQKTKL